jgi:integrase
VVFVGPKGGRLRRSNFRKIWNRARASVGLPDLHFHDLRHTGGTLSAATDAGLKELMARLGHSSVRAAMIYQHATRDRDQAIARALGALVRDVRQEAAETREEQPERRESDA